MSVKKVSPGVGAVVEEAATPQGPHAGPRAGPPRGARALAGSQESGTQCQLASALAVCGWDAAARGATAAAETDGGQRALRLRFGGSTTAPRPGARAPRCVSPGGRASALRVACACSSGGEKRGGAPLPRDQRSGPHSCPPNSRPAAPSAARLARGRRPTPPPLPQRCQRGQSEGAARGVAAAVSTVPKRFKKKQAGRHSGPPAAGRGGGRPVWCPQPQHTIALSPCGAPDTCGDTRCEPPGRPPPSINLPWRRAPAGPGRRPRGGPRGGPGRRWRAGQRPWWFLG